MATAQNSSRIQAAQRVLRMATALLMAIAGIWVPTAYFLGLAGEPVQWRDALVLVLPALLLPFAWLLFSFRPQPLAESASAGQQETVPAAGRSQFLWFFTQLLWLGGLADIVVQAIPQRSFHKAAVGVLLIAIAVVVRHLSNRPAASAQKFPKAL